MPVRPNLSLIFISYGIIPTAFIIAVSLCTSLRYSLHSAVHCCITLSGTHNYEQVKFATHKLLKGKIPLLSSVSQFSFMCELMLCYAILEPGVELYALSDL